MRAWRRALHGSRRSPTRRSGPGRSSPEALALPRHPGPAVPGRSRGSSRRSARTDQARSSPCGPTWTACRSRRATGLPTDRVDRGRMHACGHDIHMAALLGAAAIFKRATGPSARSDPPPLPTRRGAGGARGRRSRCSSAGRSSRPKVDFVVGQHVRPDSARSGRLEERARSWPPPTTSILTVSGTGGHAAFPHRGADAIVVAPPRSIRASRPIVEPGSRPTRAGRHQRREHPRRHAATTSCPDEVVLEERSGPSATGAAPPSSDGSAGVSVTSRVEPRGRAPGSSSTGISGHLEPPEATRIVVDALRREFGTTRLVELERPVMGAEDFSRYLERVPGRSSSSGSGNGPDPAAAQPPLRPLRGGPRRSGRRRSPRRPEGSRRHDRDRRPRSVATSRPCDARRGRRGPGLPRFRRACPSSRTGPRRDGGVLHGLPRLRGPVDPPIRPRRWASDTRAPGTGSPSSSMPRRSELGRLRAERDRSDQPRRPRARLEARRRGRSSPTRSTTRTSSRGRISRRARGIRLGFLRCPTIGRFDRGRVRARAPPRARGS